MGTIETLHPDNSSWTEDGTLLVTYHPASMESVFRCHEIKEGACGVPFEVLEVNPKLMQSSPVLRSPIGAGTTAIKVGSQLYIGSSSGDRLFKAPMEYGVQTYARSQN